MFTVDKDNTIHLTRGDTAVINLNLRMNNEPYELEDGDVCVLTVKTKVTSEEIVLQKDIVNGQFIINPQDTSSLQYGKYKYDIQLTKSNGVVNTVITPKDFILEYEVTW